MGQNEIFFYIMAAGCMICLMIGIVKTCIFVGAFASVGFCSMIVDGISIFCMQKGIHSSCQFKFLVYWNRCIVWSSWNCCFVCDSSVFISLINVIL